MMAKGFRIGLASIGIVLCLMLTALTRPERIVVLGDVHGDLEGLTSILRQAEIIDHAGNWIGGRTVFVQVGDLIDRGPDDRGVMDLMMQLQKQAAQSGSGDVIVLLGNHEMLNVMGDLRYVTAESFAGFIEKDSEKRAAKYRKSSFRFLKRRASELRLPKPDLGEAWDKRWTESHPPGYVEHRRALGPKGKYGKWIRKLPAVVRIDDLVFVHGGLSQKISKKKIGALNRRIRQEIKAFDRNKRYLEKTRTVLFESDLAEMAEEAKNELEFLNKGGTRLALGRSFNMSRHRQILSGMLDFGSWYSVNRDGPLWFRGYATWDDDTGRERITAIMESLSAAHVIVGHTPQLPGRIRSRFGNQILLVDSGLNSAFYVGGRPLALEIMGDRFNVISLDGRQTLSDSTVAALLPGGK